MGWLAGLVPVAYFFLGIFQVAATFAGVQHFLGVHWIIAAAVSLIIGAFPLIGTAAGVYGATAAWGWTLTSSIGLFFGPLAVMMAVMLIGERIRR